MKKPTKIKLTPAQRELLENAPTRCIASYSPAVKLVELGLAKHSKESLSSGTLNLTSKGKELLDELKSSERPKN